MYKFSQINILIYKKKDDTFPWHIAFASSALRVPRSVSPASRDRSSSDLINSRNDLVTHRFVPSFETCFYIAHCLILHMSRAEKERAQTPPFNPDSKDCGILTCRPAFIQRFAGIKVRMYHTIASRGFSWKCRGKRPFVRERRETDRDET